MDICSGSRPWRHDELVHESGECPACELHEENLRLTQKLDQTLTERDEALSARDEATKALADFERDLRVSMRMLRDAKRAVEAEG